MRMSTRCNDKLQCMEMLVRIDRICVLLQKTWLRSTLSCLISGALGGASENKNGDYRVYEEIDEYSSNAY